MSKRRFSQDELKVKIRYIVKNWDAMSNEELSSETGLSASNVSQIGSLLRKGGLQLPRHTGGARPIMTPEFMDELRKLYKPK